MHDRGAKHQNIPWYTLKAVFFDMWSMDQVMGVAYNKCTLMPLL